jgi:uncharacterized membrane protein YcaP (DUF421 family)
MDLIKDILGIGLKDLEWYQSIIRAVFVFIFAMGVIRLAGMRSFGTKTPFDVVLSITIGAILSRAITGHYPLLNCLLAAVTLALCHRGIGYLAYRSRVMRKLAEGDAVVLFEGGSLNRQRMQQYCITDEDVDKSLRENGLTDFRKVNQIVYEIDGKLNIIKHE